MFVVRNVFKCKPGKAKALTEKFAAAHELMRKDVEFESRILVDVIADFWTVVIEVTVSDLGLFDKLMQDRASSADVQQVMSGYLDLVESGRREVFRIV